MCTQATYWPEAKRRFQPIDVEYLSCECRKYYSYVNGTKKYEGKNVFTPGKSPMLTFDATPKEASPKVRSRAISFQISPMFYNAPQRKGHLSCEANFSLAMFVGSQHGCALCNFPFK